MDLDLLLHALQSHPGPDHGGSQEWRICYDAGFRRKADGRKARKCAVFTDIPESETMNESKSSSGWDDRLDVHNPNVDEAATAGRCGTVHLSTGRMCPLPSLHDGACQFASTDPAIRNLPGPRD